MAEPRTILFAGGGTGGHIFPNLAVLERLRELKAPIEPHFLVSNRPLDKELMDKHGLPFTALPVQPWHSSPLAWWGFRKAWRASMKSMAALLREKPAAALVATGGFVSGPAVIAAHKAGVKIALLNLDAVPGKANRVIARKASALMSAYPHPDLGGAQIIGLPLRRVAIGAANPSAARQALGLDPQRDTVLVMGGSQGAQSLNHAMARLVQINDGKGALSNAQVLHLAGPAEVDELRKNYEANGIPAKVLSFCDEVGQAWSAATLAVSRAGASAVAEAWANAVPTIFLPYPYHKDQHQRFNAAPMVQAGGAVLQPDLPDPTQTALQVAQHIRRLRSNPTHLHRMAAMLRDRQPADGATVVAQWVVAQL